MSETPTYNLDGSRINSLDDFWIVIGEAVNGPGGYFASNLDALDDALDGGTGQPSDCRCTFLWQRADHSRVALGYPETVRQLERRLAACHPTSKQRVEADLAEARAGRGPTVWDWLIAAFADSPATLVLRD